MPPRKTTPLTIACALMLLSNAAPAQTSNSVPPPSPPRPADSAKNSKSTYFLLQRIKAVTDSGIIGIAAGTQLEMVGKTSAGLKVKTKDGTEFEVTADQITNDPAKAQASKEQADAADAQSKAQRDAIIAAQNAKLKADRERTSAAMDSLTSGPSLIAAPSSTPGAHVGGGTALDQAAKSEGHVNVHKRPQPKR